MIIETEKKINIRCRGIIVHEGKLLVVRHAPNDVFFALPGGHLEWGEKINDCFKREMVEELGINPQVGRLLYINNIFDEGRQSIEFFFEILNSADYLDIEKLGGTHKFELAEICWVGKDDNKKILPDQIQTDLNNNTLLSDTVRFI